MRPAFFATPADFRGWLERHHADATELLVGFYKKGSGRPSMTWPESVDQALCYGWIDGIRRGLDEESYTIRFTPRKPRSVWSAVNIERARQLTEQGLMRPAGLAAFQARADDRSAIYSYEQRHAAVLGPEHEEQFQADARAWQFFHAQPPSYRKTAIYWVTSAKRPETRQRRLGILIGHSAAGRRLPQLTGNGTVSGRTG